MSNNNIPNNPNDTNSSRASSLNERKPYSRRTPQSITFSDDDTDSDEMSYTSEDDYYETHDMYDDDDSDIEIAPVFQTTTEIDRNEPQVTRPQPRRPSIRETLTRVPPPRPTAPPERIPQPVPRRRPQSPPPRMYHDLSDEEDVEDFINYVFTSRGDNDEFTQRLRNFFRTQLLNRIRGEAQQRQSLIDRGIDPRLADLVLQDRDFTDADYETLLLLDKHTKPKSVPSKIIESIKTRKVEEADISKGACSICLTDFCVGELCKELRCKHLFHVECIDQWLKKYNHVCPMCKQSVLEEEK